MAIHADGKSRERQGQRIVLAMGNRHLSMTNGGRTVDLLQPGAEKEVMVAHGGKRVRQGIGRIQQAGLLQ